MDNLLSTPHLLDAQVDLIREVFHYQSRFEGSTMVFKIDFPVTKAPGFPGLVKDIALLAKTGFKIVIVPGVKESIDIVLKQQNIESNYTDTDDFPIRITTQNAISFVEMAAFNAASRFMTFLSGSRIDAVIGNFVRARGLGVLNGIDTEHTGTVDKIYVDSLNKVLDLGMIPILPCIGWSPAGKPYNVPSDEIALAVSQALGAVKLFIVSMSDIPKDLVLPENTETRADGSIIRLTPKQTEDMIKLNSNLPDFLATSTHGSAVRELAEFTLKDFHLALKASKAGIHRVHIIDGREEGAVLKELFSNLGVGTMVYTDEYDSIRPLRSSDLPDILRLMEPLMQTGVLIRRTPLDIQNKKEDYSVLEIDGKVRACGALHNWGDSQGDAGSEIAAGDTGGEIAAGEIAAVATDPQYTDLGLGRKIVGYLIEKAKKAGMKRVFVLTTQTHDWFEAMGFKEANVDFLPAQKRKEYDKKRGSKVFVLEL